MNKNSKPPTQVLSKLMQASLCKNPELAAKQARLLAKLKGDPNSSLYAGSTSSKPQAETSSEAPNPMADAVNALEQFYRDTANAAPTPSRASEPTPQPSSAREQYRPTEPPDPEQGPIDVGALQKLVQPDPMDDPEEANAFARHRRKP